MLETKEQKQNFVGAVILIILLIVATAWRKASFQFVENIPSQTKTQFDYNAYLASINIDRTASKQLFEHVVTEEDIKKQIEQDLQVAQPVTAPVLADSSIKHAAASGKDAVTAYLQQVGQVSSGFDTATANTAKEYFNPSQDPKIIDDAIAKNQSVLQQLYALPVPAEAMNLHKSALSVYTAYLDSLQLAKSYIQNSKSDPWSHVYGDYQTINSQMVLFTGQLHTLDSKYHMSGVAVFPQDAHVSSSFFIPTAQAFGPTIVIGNIPQAIKEAIEQGLASAFSNFATQFLNKLIASIEKNYKIANFLYYTDALVNGQYVQDYLDKYVSSSLDKTLVTNFIPEFTCGQAQDVKKVLKAKADQFLGFDPQTLSAQDPDYYSKMARMGDVLSSSSGWELYYENLAHEAQAKAEQAANQELVSPGLKSARDVTGTQIASSLASINDSMQAIFSAQLNLGVVNVDKIVSQVVSSVTYNLFNNFVFRGAVVYKEQSSCVPVPQIQPILPAGVTPYQQPAPAPDPNQVYKDQCATLPGGCSTTP